MTFVKKYIIENEIDDEVDSQSEIPQKETVIEAGLLTSLGGGQYNIKINGADRTIRILGMSDNKIEFMLDDFYHTARYVSRTIREFSLVVDGCPLTLGTNTELDNIVYKNSGGSGGAGAAGSSQTALKSQIPGKVVSVAVSEGDTVAKGDVICTLESMKMQVAVKAHKGGVIKSIKAKESVTFAKGDVIAEID